MRDGHLNEISPDRIEAVIFDMDGVVTDTARVHAMAWKRLFDEYLRKRSRRLGERFQPFDAGSDYLRFVDGKPRYDGVNSFLDSRGISLPYGDPEDSPDQETVCGLGNRKNQHFLERLKKQGARAYPSTVSFIHGLKASGIRTAVISASRNCQQVLEAAGVQELFDARVDGVDAAELGLKGKPEPDIFLEAASRLHVEPARAAVVEDALAGVEAGRRGNFALVIGLDRAEQAQELRQQGADVVVRDLSEVRVRKPARPHKPAVRTQSVAALPSALEEREHIYDRLRQGTAAIFLDYDGTLTPIVEKPGDALLPEEGRKALKRLLEHYTVAIISGRDLADVRGMVGLDEIVYAGSHGFDIAGLRDKHRQRDGFERFLPALDAAEAALRDSLGGIPGAHIERKKFAVTVHYRQVEDARQREIERKVDELRSLQPGLRKAGGKKVVELLPDVDWNKGKALLWLLDALYAEGARAIPLYIGDDVTDEDAFAAIQDCGIGIYVGKDGQRQTAAHYVLADPAEVRVFLNGLAALAESDVSQGRWALTYEGFDPGQEGLREALCTVGNGYFATRGAAPEATAGDVHYPGTYVAGLYNRLKTEISGQTIENECLVNIPNWLPLTFRLENGGWFDLGSVALHDYRQELDLRRGTLSRFVLFSDDQGRRTRLSQRRFVSMASPHLAALETTIVAENWSGRVQVRSALDGRVANTGVHRYRQLASKHLVPVESGAVGEDTVLLQVETNQSHIRIAEAARTRLFRSGERLEVRPVTTRETACVSQEFDFEMEQGQAVTIEKVVAVSTSRDRAISESGLQAQKVISRAPGFDELLDSHVLRWDHLWRRCQLSIEDSERAALILNLHVFHLLQTVSPNTIDLDAGVPPRGLHGEAYRGHILWDELFIFPFLNLRVPDLTRALLMYRYRRLPEARWAARQEGYAGAMYPWQSGSDGREESQHLHLNPRSGRWLPDNSHRQRHISIAIAYNVWLYYEATRDIDFLFYYGAEMVIDIARFLCSIAEYNRSLDRYEVKGVMGPDEYHEAYPDAAEPGINNNAYTNIMTVWVMRHALRILDLIPEDRREALWDNLGLRREEVERWEDISRKMRVVFHDDDIISQFEGYGELQEFDWEGYRRKYGNIERLDRILEAEGDTPNRYKLSKQADVLMLFYLLSAEELRELFERLGYAFRPEMIPNNVDYYMKRTAHGSTLSRVVHSWVLARSKRELSWHLFREALESDVCDIQGGTTPEGIHLGAMAGTVDLIQRCYTGIETRGDRLWFNPYLPSHLKEVGFDVLYRQHWINVCISGERLRLSSRPSEASPVNVGVRNDLFELRPGETREFDLERE